LPGEAARHGHVKDLEKALKELEKSLKHLKNDKKASGKPGLKHGELKGVILAVDEQTRTLTLRVKDKGMEWEAAYILSADVRLRWGSTTLKLADLKRGQFIKATLRDRNTLAEIKLEKKPD
jgi:hypothetical protein